MFPRKKNDILLNPGPVTLSPRVKRAFLNPDVCHREKEFFLLHETICRGLLGVYGASAKKYCCLLMSGSGTVAVEAALASLIPESGKVLILINGVYGERMRSMAGVHRIPHVCLEYAWGQDIPFSDIERILLKDKRITHVAAVHHETTTGRLNDLGSIGALCRRYGKEFIVDAVSSFGAEELRFAEWNIACVAATSGKCLHAAPGVSFVIVKRRLLDTKKMPAPRSVYMDLFNYYKEQKQGSFPFTHATQLFFALAEALSEYKAMGGFPARQKRYRALSTLIRRRAQEIGLRLYLARGQLSCVLTAFYLPAHITYAKLHDKLRKERFVIYAGQKKLARIIFRIATMGAVKESDIERLCKVLKGIVCRR